MDEIKKILIANRGVCACRIMKTCFNMHIAFATIFTPDDQQSLHVKDSKETYAVESYMDINRIIQVARQCNATAIHPGYGFQSENYVFAEKCEEANIIFIGPTTDNMKVFSKKHVAKEEVKKAGGKLTTAPSSDLVKDINDAVKWATVIGYPIILKPTSGGGGIGIQVCRDERELRKQFEKSYSLGVKYFQCGEMLVEKFIPLSRHVEVQVFGDGKGNVIHLGERECSVQRRHQKVIEEAPCPALTQELRERLCEMAVNLCQSVKYKSTGTVEFLFDEQNQEFFFLEVNTRLQVEHRVTELLYNVDLVEWMINLAFSPNEFDLAQISLQPYGHTIECRIYAEDPMKAFKPSSATMTEFILPHENSTCHVDTWVYRGCYVKSKYDPLLANVVQWGPTRTAAVTQLIKSLRNSNIDGPLNNLDYVTNFIASRNFMLANTHVNILNSYVYTPRCMEVLSPGLLTTVQDWPGRLRRGLWRVGVPPSGPMDHLACRVANRLVGNPENSAVLEVTITGPSLKIHCDTYVALTGASIDASVDGKAIPMWRRISVKNGSTLTISRLNSKFGCRVYLGIAGGIDVPHYLGSRSTFPNGHFGGYQGRPLKCGDLLKLGAPRQSSFNEESVDVAEITEEYREKWEIGVLPGPHANPEFFTDRDMAMFYNTEWEVHHNSNRLGIRLMGPAPEWSRSNGGEGGSHPSNIHDCEYTVGTVNFTGNMPIIIAQDGPSLGGFVCPCTIVHSELWKIGQVKPGDTIKFRKTTIKDAVQKRLQQNQFITTLTGTQHSQHFHHLDRFPPTNAILHKIPASASHPGAEFRLAGDSHILIEYGAMILDLNLRFRVHFLELWLLKHRIDGLEETAPGVRSLQVRYDPTVLPLVDLIAIVAQGDGQLCDISHLSISTRVLYLPMCFDYSGVDKTISRYMKSVRPEAPYLPSNIEYIAKNNGLAGAEDVKEKVFAASYMCLGLGDVYLGACCAVPVNPLHRLVATKYNPARTFTQEGTVGLGGSYMCIYPMDSPGGYQLVGRTLPIWDTFAVSNPKLFSQDKPWLLRMFDQIRFYAVSESELDLLRTQFSTGRLQIRVEKEEFNIAKYNASLKSMAEATHAYRKSQDAAAAEMLREEEKSLIDLKQHGAAHEFHHSDTEKHVNDAVPQGCVGVHSFVTGEVWEILATVGEHVVEQQEVVTIEAMKMECSCHSPNAGTVSSVLVKVGQFVYQGDLLMIIRIQQDISSKL